MNDTMSSEQDPMKRIADLEAELAYVKKQRDMYKTTVSSLSQTVYDPELDRPMTPEELDDMMNSPRGGSISEIVAEVDQIVRQR